ncbi:putative virulent strain associated lipoprotein, related protein, partial [Toxoplasma gondii TgCatPRC2]
MSFYHPPDNAGVQQDQGRLPTVEAPCDSHDASAAAAVHPTPAIHMPAFHGSAVPRLDLSRAEAIQRQRVNIPSGTSTVKPAGSQVETAAANAVPQSTGNVFVPNMSVPSHVMAVSTPGYGYGAVPSTAFPANVMATHMLVEPNHRTASTTLGERVVQLRDPRCGPNTLCTGMPFPGCGDGIEIPVSLAADALIDLSTTRSQRIADGCRCCAGPLSVFFGQRGRQPALPVEPQRRKTASVSVSPSPSRTSFRYGHFVDPKNAYQERFASVPQPVMTEVPLNAFPVGTMPTMVFVPPHFFAGNKGVYQGKPCDLERRANEQRQSVSREGGQRRAGDRKQTTGMEKLLSERENSDAGVGGEDRKQPIQATMQAQAKRERNRTSLADACQFATGDVTVAPSGAPVQATMVLSAGVSPSKPASDKDSNVANSSVTTGFLDLRGTNQSATKMPTTEGRRARRAGSETHLATLESPLATTEGSLPASSSAAGSDHAQQNSTGSLAIWRQLEETKEQYRRVQEQFEMENESLKDENLRLQEAVVSMQSRVQHIIDVLHTLKTKNAGHPPTCDKTNEDLAEACIGLVAQLVTREAVVMPGVAATEAAALQRAAGEAKVPAQIGSLGGFTSFTEDQLQQLLSLQRKDSGVKLPDHAKSGETPSGNGVECPAGAADICPGSLRKAASPACDAVAKGATSAHANMAASAPAAQRRPPLGFGSAAPRRLSIVKRESEPCLRPSKPLHSNATATGKRTAHPDGVHKEGSVDASLQTPLKPTDGKTRSASTIPVPTSDDPQPSSQDAPAAKPQESAAVEKAPLMPTSTAKAPQESKEAAKAPLVPKVAPKDAPAAMQAPKAEGGEPKAAATAPEAADAPKAAVVAKVPTKAAVVSKEGAKAPLVPKVAPKDAPAATQAPKAEG